MDFAFIPANGASRGLLSMWNSSLFMVENMIKLESFLWLQVKISSGGVQCLVGNVYVPNSEEDIAFFFESLSEVIDLFTRSCLICGDYNVFLNLGERSGSPDVVDLSFCYFVGSNNLMDLPLKNYQFTWYSSRDNDLWSRLGRWIINEAAINGFEGISQVAENWGLYDHRPVIMSMGAINYGPKRFLFYNSWLLDQEFEGVVKEWWCSSTVVGWSGFVLQQKLETLKTNTRNWKGYSRKGTNEKILSLEIGLIEIGFQELMHHLEENGVSVELRRRRMSILDELWHEYRVEENRWRQEARTNWLKCGDRNIAYFHTACKVRQLVRKIQKLVVNGATEDPVKEAVFEHFKSFFSREDMCRP
ncbi:uncharacterized protein LOC130736051 [Lotus japonicus]|uniref:uncharacterized protein LOC130736051 n=1 Tax=Lotus japonicus TaxID=34305 RepID=UPI0025831FB9|nr:uncharacterized protein LOC130736051 [Lotus japonicus]